MIICLSCDKVFDIIIEDAKEDEDYILQCCPFCKGEDCLDTDDSQDVIIGVN